MASTQCPLTQVHSSLERYWLRLTLQRINQAVNYSRGERMSIHERALRRAPAPATSRSGHLLCQQSPLPPSASLSSARRWPNSGQLGHSGEPRCWQAVLTQLPGGGGGYQAWPPPDFLTEKFQIYNPLLLAGEKKKTSGQ